MSESIDVQIRRAINTAVKQGTISRARKQSTIVGPTGPSGHTPVKGVDYFDGEPGEILESATFTYNDGLLTRIDFSSGKYKTFTYNDNNDVTEIVWNRLTSTTTKTFTYNEDGTVSIITVITV